MGGDKQTPEELIDTSCEISELLGLNHPQNLGSLVINNANNKEPQDSIFGIEGICNGHTVKPLPNRYFIAQEFGKESNDLRMSIGKAFADFGMESIRADDNYWGGPILCNICSLIQGTPFGVYQLSVSQNKNVYLELGIAMGLGKPFVLVKDRGAIVPELIQGLRYYSINSYLETGYELGRLAKQYITEILEYQPQKIHRSGVRKAAVIALGGVEQVDIGVTIAKELFKSGFVPVFLGQVDDKIESYLRRENVSCEYSRTRDEIVKAIQVAKFGIYRVDKSASADAFITLGIAFGLNRPFLLISNAMRNRQDGIPADIKGLQNLEFHGFVHLAEKFAVELPNWLKKQKLCL